MNFPTALMYLGFFALIGTTCYFLNSGWPLAALLFTPSYNEKSTKDD